MSLTRKIDPRHFSTVYGHTVNKVKDFVEKEILKGEDKPWTLTTSLDEGDTRPMVLVLDKEPMSLSYWRLPLDLESEDEQRRKPFLNTVYYLPEIYNPKARDQYYDRIKLDFITARTIPFVSAFKISITGIEMGYYIIENGITRFNTNTPNLPFYTEPFEIRIPIQVKDQVKVNRFEVNGQSIYIVSDPIKGNFEIGISEYSVLQNVGGKRSQSNTGVKPVKREESSISSYFNVYPDNKQEIVKHVDAIGRILYQLIYKPSQSEQTLKKVNDYIKKGVILPRWFD